MDLRKKLLKVVAVMYGCTALLSFGKLPQKMIDDVQEMLRYLEVPGHITDRTKIIEMPQKDIKRGYAAYTKFNHEGYPIISLDKNMFSNHDDSVKNILIYHTLLREAVCVSYFGQIPYKQYQKDRQDYWREENNYQECSLSKEKLSQSLKKYSIFFLVSSLASASFWLANDVKTKIGSLGKILGGCAFVSAVIVCKKLFSSYRSNKRLSVYRNDRSDYEEMLKFMAREEQGNIIDNLGVSEARFRSLHKFRKEANKMRANFPDESWASRIHVMIGTSYNRGKCIQMRDAFLVNVGTLAVMFHRDRKNYDEYIDYLENTIEVNQNLDFSLLEKRLYADEFIKNTGCKKEVQDNLWCAGKNKGPYAKIADGYLREKILGLFEKDLQVHQGNIKEYIRVREKDLQVYQGDIKEYIRARDQGKRPIHLKLKRPAWWDQPLAKSVLDEQE